MDTEQVALRAPPTTAGRFSFLFPATSLLKLSWLPTVRLLVSANDLIFLVVPCVLFDYWNCYSSTRLPPSSTFSSLSQKGHHQAGSGNWTDRCIRLMSRTWHVLGLHDCRCMYSNCCRTWKSRRWHYFQCSSGRTRLTMAGRISVLRMPRLQGI